MRSMEGALRTRKLPYGRGRQLRRRMSIETALSAPSVALRAPAPPQAGEVQGSVALPDNRG
jgi:hypothetical protein